MYLYCTSKSGRFFENLKRRNYEAYDSKINLIIFNVLLIQARNRINYFNYEYKYKN